VAEARPLAPSAPRGHAFLDAHAQVELGRRQRLRLPEVKTSAYEQLDAVAAEHLKRHHRKSERAELVNVWWAMAHGVTRLMIDGALPITEAQAFALMERSLNVVLG